MPRSKGRSGRPWQRIHDQRIAQGKANNEPCYVCHTTIDYTLTGRAKWGPTIEHIIGLADGGHPTDPANQAISHRTCNVSRGNHQRQARQTGQALNPSRNW